MTWRTVILAAGKGTRMGSDRAKVLHRLGSETLLGQVLNIAARLDFETAVVVVGHQHEAVRDAHKAWNVEFVVQEPQLGTGHAVQQAIDALRGHEGHTLILYGDVPLLRRSSLLELMEAHLHSGHAVTVLTARVPDASGYGRIVRGADGSLVSITEDRDLNPEQRSIDEINSGIYAFRTRALLESIGGLRPDNDQKELYLTDTIGMLREGGESAGTYTLRDPQEISGINTPRQLEEAGTVLEERRRLGTEDCPVCSLAEDSGEAGRFVLIRREHAILVVAPDPYNSGQLVVYPKRHCLRHTSLDEGEVEQLWDLGRLASELVEDLYRPQGMNLGYTSGRPGEHLGLQVVPRWVGDTNFMPLLADRTLLPETVEQTYSRVDAALRERGIGS